MFKKHHRSKSSCFGVPRNIKSQDTPQSITPDTLDQSPQGDTPQSQSLGYDENRYKLVIVELEGLNEIRLLIDKEEQNMLTCEWLLNTVKEKIIENNSKSEQKIDVSKIIALKTKARKLAIDYWLTLSNKDLSVLEDTLVLLPYYATEIVSHGNTHKPSIQDYQIEAKIGNGGFASVYLGIILMAFWKLIFIIRKKKGHC